MIRPSTISQHSAHLHSVFTLDNTGSVEENGFAYTQSDKREKKNSLINEFRKNKNMKID